MLKTLNYLVRKYIPVLKKERRQRQERLNSKYKFTNRQKGHNNLLILVCGYKPALWNDYFERISSFLIEGLDVCIVCPGITQNDVLNAKAAQHNYSILFCEKNKLGVAQNLAIRNHINAQLIFKLDEDIIIPEHYFESMLSLYHAASSDPKYNLGYVAPLIHINGYSYHRLLEKLGKTHQYESQFGQARSACVDLEVWRNPEAAKYLWDIIAPFDQTASTLLKEGKTYTICPHRFSIGAILFNRKFWQDINYFATGPEAYLGLEEVQMAEFCAAEAVHVMVSEEILVGHFSFGPQYKAMLEYLKKNPEMLKIKTTSSESPSIHREPA